jgi:anaerobic magnesium-protoporphyrin IX monomethyl ester cyclase
MCGPHTCLCVLVPGLARDIVRRRSLRVLLINPKFHLPIDTRTTPHLGLAYLAAVSERRGDEVSIFDMDVEDISLAEHISAYRPHIVGISSNTPQVQQAWRDARSIKAITDVPIVIGGPHPSALPDESAARPEIDVVVRGEGEATWLELCDIVDRARAGGDLTGTALLDPANHLLDAVHGITYKTPSGAMQCNRDRAAIEDLDSLPWPAYHFFKMDRYTSLQPAMDRVEGARSFSMMTSRGCPYRCTFCSQSIMPEKWRARSPQSVVAEFRHLIKDLGAQEIGVLDDSANINRKRLSEISQMLIDEGLNTVPWNMINGMRANLADKDMLSLMKRAGCIRSAFGVETGDEGMLVSINKNENLDQIRQAFKNAKEVGMETVAFFIIGLPGDTEETIERSIRFAIELDPLVANFSMMTPYPGTLVYEQIKSGGGQILLKSWDDYVFFAGKARYVMGELTAEVQERKFKEAYRRFYLRPSRVLQTLTRKSTWLNFPRTASMALKVIFPKATKESV